MITNRKHINFLGYCFKYLTNFTIEKPRSWFVPFDVNSLYPWQQSVGRGLRKKELAVIVAHKGVGKSYFKEMYEAKFTDEN